jgi:hypothetical protein
MLLLPHPLHRLQLFRPVLCTSDAKHGHAYRDRCHV